MDRSGRTDFELVAVGGIYDHPLGHGVTLSSSAQAGIVGIKARDLFIDGAAQIEHIVIRHGSARLSFGAAVWGAAQPSLSRLDAGPTAALRFRLGVVTAKAEASYRVRLIGTARPTTGPALSLGTDF